MKQARFPANAPGKAAERGPSAWAPAFHTADLNGVPGSRLYPGPALATVIIWGVNQQIEHLSLCISFLLIPAFSIKTVYIKCVHME